MAQPQILPFWGKMYHFLCPFICPTSIAKYINDCCLNQNNSGHEMGKYAASLEEVNICPLLAIGGGKHINR